MKVTRVAASLAVAVAVVALSGCAGYSEYMWRSAKPNLNSYTKTQYQPNSYEVLGTVKAETQMLEVVGVYIGGTDGQGILWAHAKEKYGDRCTGIKDITATSEVIAVLPPIFSRIDTTYYGTAVQEK